MDFAAKLLSQIPLAVVYAGLGGTILALIVASAQNKWELRVILLLALRLAIGWHFLFEGLHKIHSHYMGQTETSRPFTSEPYFAAAEGPVGEVMRKKYLGDVDGGLAAKVTPDPGKVGGFAALSPAEQAALCPAPVAELLAKAAKDGHAAAEAEVPKAWEAAAKAKAESKVAPLTDAANKAKTAAGAALAEATKAESDAERAKAEAVLAAADKVAATKDKAATADKVAREAKAKLLAATDAAAFADKKVADEQKKLKDAEDKVAAAAAKVEALANDGQGLKVTYARWVYGVDRRDAKTKFVSTDVPQTVLERLSHIALMRKNLESLEARQKEELGNGYAHEQKRTTQARADLNAAKADLLKDADDFASGLVEYATGKPVPVPEKPIKQLDEFTMWAITAIGACLLLGLFTPAACLAGAGFLLVTYLTHPPFPWYPLPPNTEGNPLFVNKNVIEMIALLVVAVHPTGRWLGLDAIWCRLLFKK